VSLVVFHYKKKRRQAEQTLLGLDTSGRGKDLEKGCRRVNMVGNIVYTDM
jgi:hypothetical protein